MNYGRDDRRNSGSTWLYWLLRSDDEPGSKRLEVREKHNRRVAKARILKVKVALTALALGWLAFCLSCRVWLL